MAALGNECDAQSRHVDGDAGGDEGELAPGTGMIEAKEEEVPTVDSDAMC